MSTRQRDRSYTYKVLHIKSIKEASGCLQHGMCEPRSSFCQPVFTYLEKIRGYDGEPEWCFDSKARV